MTSAKKTNLPSLDPATQAVVMQTGNGWRVLIAKVGNGVPVVTEMTDIPAEPTKLRNLLTDHRAGQTLFVIPASRTITKTCLLPAASEDQVQAALSLQLETLPGNGIPAHRLAGAVLPPAPGSAQRRGIMCAWPEASDAPWPAVDGTVRYIPETAALAALMHDMLPAEPMLCVHPDSGDIALSLTHEGTMRLRSMRETTGSPDEFRRAVRTIVLETALNAGCSPAALDEFGSYVDRRLGALPPVGPSLIVPDDVAGAVINRLGGAFDRSRLAAFGILVGALLAATGPLSPLAQLQDRVETLRPSLAARTLERLAQPTTAYRAVALLLIVLLFGPLAATWLRVQVLNVRFSDVAADRRKVDDVRLRLAMYETLGEETWSMTKALGDLATNAPRGVEVEAIRLTTADRSFRIVGIVRNHNGELAPRIINRMEVNLNNTGMFGSLTPIIGSGDAFGAYQFELSGKFPTAVAPFRHVHYPVDLDFARYSLAARMQNLPPPSDEPARTDDVRPVSAADLDRAAAPAAEDSARAAADRPADPAAGSAAGSGTRTAVRPQDPVEPGDEEEDRRTRRIDGGPAIGRDPGAPTRADASGSLQVDPNLIPDPITPEQIESLTFSEARATIAVISDALKIPSVERDAELSGRLRREFQLVFEHMRKVGDPPGGANR